MKTIIRLLILSLFFTACNQNKNLVYKDYSKALEKCESLEKRANNIAKTNNREDLCLLLSELKELSFVYNPIGLDSNTVVLCEKLKEHIENFQSRAIQNVEELLMNSTITISENKDVLLEDSKIYPIYFKKGEKLIYSIDFESSGNLKIYNADAKKLLRSRSSFKSSRDSLTIPYSGIYLVELIPNSSQYVTVSLFYKPIDQEGFFNAKPLVLVKKESCSSKAFKAHAAEGIQTRNIFEQPRKFTLRGQLKAAFSGNSRSVVALKVPAGTTDILYSVRISTSEQDRSNDGEFYNNINHSYREIQFMGLPVYKSTKSAGLLNMILDDNRPITYEDAYCNMYVFRSSTQARKFQDESVETSKLSYDLDHSSMGTQSCNGRIPVNGAQTIYLGFENERMRFSNYLWVEAVGIIPCTEYFNYKYSVEK